MSNIKPKSCSNIHIETDSKKRCEPHYWMLSLTPARHSWVMRKLERNGHRHSIHTIIKQVSRKYIFFNRTCSVMQNLQYKRTSMSFKKSLVYSLIEALVGILEFDTIWYSSNALVNFKVCSLKRKKPKLFYISIFISWHFIYL